MIEFDTAVQPAPRGTSPQTEPQQASQSWLREWEQARWQEQPRYETQGPQDDKALAVAQAQAAAVDTKAIATQSLVEAPSAPLSRDDSVSAVEPQPGVVSAQALPHASRSQAAFAVAQPAVSQPSAANTKAARPAAPAVEASAADVATRPKWAAHSVHVHVGEQATSVWIRDANLTAQQALAVLERLRPNLNTAGGTAALPLHLTLNGQAVKHTPTR
jgi:hypothetical protein